MTVRRTELRYRGQLLDMAGIEQAVHTLEELLLELGLGDLNLDSLVDLLLVTTSVICVVLDGCGEEGVDEGRLSEARLSCYLD